MKKLALVFGCISANIVPRNLGDSKSLPTHRVLGEHSNVLVDFIQKPIPELIEKTRHAAKLAANLFENNFVFREQLRIRINCTWICEYPGCAVTPGKSIPSDSFYIKDHFSNKTVYSQALVKQHAHASSQVGDFDSYYDVLVDIYGDFNYYYPKDYPSPIRSDQYDFLKLLLHETIHGLGFNSRLRNVYANCHLPPDTPLGLARPTFFDYFLVDKVTHRPLAQAANEARPANSPNRNQDLLILVLALSTPGRVVFPTISGENVTVHTSDFVFERSVPSHISPTYQSTQEDLMTPFVSKGLRMTDHLYKFPSWHSSPFGPATLDILASLGYALKVPNPSFSLQYYYQYKKDNKGEVPYLL